MIDRLKQQLGARGIDVTLNYYTGTDCPCRTYNDADNYSYSPEWHRLYPTAADCAGTMKINRNRVKREIKAFVGNLLTLLAADTFRELIPAGKFEKNDLAAISALDDATLDILNMDTYETDQTAYITINRVDYTIISVPTLMLNGENYYLLILRKS